MITAFGIVIFGGSVGGGLAKFVGLGPVFQTVWGIVQWPIVACVVLFTFAIIYFFAPAAKQRFAWISPGAVLAFVFWLLFSLLFSLYAGSVGGDSYNETYGSLAGVIVLMLYVYYSALIMLVGAEMNQVIEWHIPGGKDEGDKVPEDERKPDAHRLNREEGRDSESR
jgi:membrane protein